MEFPDELPVPDFAPVEPEVEPFPGVVEALPVEPVVEPMPVPEVEPLPCVGVELDAPVPVPDVLPLVGDVPVVPVSLQGTPLGVDAVQTDRFPRPGPGVVVEPVVEPEVVPVLKPVPEPVPLEGCVPTPTEPCDEFPVPLELPSMGVGFLPELVPVELAP
jgi:hypothetical protein